MTLRNFLVGVPVMLLCLVVQVAVVFWCVRYCARRSTQGSDDRVLIATVGPLAVSMLAMMIANVLQIALWGYLFLQLGQFEALYPAIYHSAVNFTSLGYGDVVMGAEWKLLGPLEAANGVLMMSMTAAALTAILQNVIRSQVDAIVAGPRRGRDSGD
jgi:Ion channel